MIYGPVASKHSNRRSLLYASSMAYLGRTTGRHRHGVGKGGGLAGTGGGGDYGGREERGQRDQERMRNGGGRGGRVRGRIGSREKEKPLVGYPKTQ